MAEGKQLLFARNLICICIDGKENADYQGKIWHQYSDDSIYFDSANELLMVMDDLYDEWDFPQRGLEKREFHKNKHEEKLSGDNSRLVIDEIQKRKGVRNIQDKKGELGTFLVQVAFRQNATWQGHVICVENNEKYDFVSALSLLEIIGECVK